MKRDKKALTFIEIIISLSLLAIIFIGFAEVLEVGMRSVYRTNQEIIATSLARGMMSEIISKQFCDSSDTNCTGSLGPETGEVRSNNTNTFDDMDDYHNYTDSPPITIGSQVMDGTVGAPNYSGFSRSVLVKYVTENMVDSILPTDYKKVEVTVTAPGISAVIVTEVKVK